MIHYAGIYKVPFHSPSKGYISLQFYICRRLDERCDGSKSWNPRKGVVISFIILTSSHGPCLTGGPKIYLYLFLFSILTNQTVLHIEAILPLCGAPLILFRTLSVMYSKQLLVCIIQAK